MKGIRDLSKIFGLKEKELKQLFLDRGILVNPKTINPDLITAGKANSINVWVNQHSIMVGKNVYDENYVAEKIADYLVRKGKENLHV